MTWDSLTAILREAKADADAEGSTQPSACPHCGEPLRAGPRGEVFCRFDGYVWEG